MPKASPSLRTKMDAALSKTSWSTAVKNDLGSTLRLRCFRDPNGGPDPYATGTEFLNCAMAGPLNLNATTGAIESLGALSGVTLHTTANLATGSSCLRIEGNGLFIQYSLGLAGSGKDFTVPANIAPGTGFAFHPSASLVPPTALPISDPGTGGGGSTPTPIGSTIATMTVNNTDSVTASGGFIAPMFGHPFKKGDIPSGYYPMFELTDGTFVPCTMFGQVTWADGSLKFASFLIRLPNSVAAGASVSVRIKATTTAPGSSSRSLSDLSAGGADLNVSVVGVDQLSGTWVSKLNQGVIDADDIVLFGDGPVGKIWRIRQQFMQSGANHGQLECYWYVTALQDSAGGLYGIRHLARVTQPWYNIDTPAKAARSFSSVKLNNGATLLRECVVTHAQTVTSTTLASNGDGTTGVPLTAHTFGMSRMVRFTGTTLFTGLSANTSYLVQTPYQNNIVVTDLNGVRINLSGTCSADMTASALVYIPHFSSFFTCGANGRWDYTQGAGSRAADPKIYLAHDKNYWMTTKVVPPYDPITPTALETGNYEANGADPWTAYTNTTGDRADIGVLAGQHVKHLLSQSPVSEQTVRVSSLTSAGLPTNCLNATTKTFVPLINGTYAGMPTPVVDFLHNTNYTNGYTMQSGGPMEVGLLGNDSSHRPPFSYYPYLLTGEPQNLDLMLENGWGVVAYLTVGPATLDSKGGVGRRVTLNGTQYDGIVLMQIQLRGCGWALRDASVAAGLCPDVAPHCASYKKYFNDIVDTNLTVLNGYINTLATPYQKTAGFYAPEGGSFADTWMQAYVVGGLAVAATVAEKAQAMSPLNMMANWSAYLQSKFGVYFIPSYEILIRTGENQPYITSDSQIGFYYGSVTFTSSTNTVNYTPSGGYTLRNDDVILLDAAGRNGYQPLNMTPNTSYYVINATANSFQISLTQGGAPFAFGTTNEPGNAGANAHPAIFIRPISPVTTGSIEGSVQVGSIKDNVCGHLKYAKAAGATVSQAAIDALEAQLAGANFSASPKYRFADHF